MITFAQKKKNLVSEYHFKVLLTKFFQFGPKLSCHLRKFYILQAHKTTLSQDAKIVTPLFGKSGGAVALASPIPVQSLSSRFQIY